MAIRELTVQVNNSDHLSTQVNLDGELFRLDFYTTKAVDLSTGLPPDTTKLWYIDLYDSQGNALVLGLGMATGIDILHPYRALGVPKGKLFVAPSNEGTFIDPDSTAFSEDRAHLYYQTEDSAFPS